jgi:peptide/nickel transport system permease protein
MRQRQVIDLRQQRVEAIFQRDCPVVQGVMLFVATIYVAVNLLVDLTYPLFDPRVTAE